MPSLELIVDALDAVGLPADGNLVLDPPLPDLNRVLLRRLICWLRVPQIPGAKSAVLDTGAPISIFPHKVWFSDFGWRAGRDYDEICVTDLGTTFAGHVLSYRYSFRLARLRAPVILAGKNLGGDRLQLDSLVCQLTDPGGPRRILLGLWGGVFEDRRLVVEREPSGDDLRARLEF